MKRDIRVSYRGRDVAGLRTWREGHAAFYSLDRKFQIHVSAHDPAPPRYPRGVVKITPEPGDMADAAAAILIGPVDGEGFDSPLRDERNPVRLGDLLVYVDDENLGLFPASTRTTCTRLVLPSRNVEFLTVSAWLVPPHHYYALPEASEDAVAYGIESSAAPWLVIAVAAT